MNFNIFKEETNFRKKENRRKYDRGGGHEAPHILEKFTFIHLIDSC